MLTSTTRAESLRNGAVDSGKKAPIYIKLTIVPFSIASFASPGMLSVSICLIVLLLLAYPVISSYHLPWCDLA
jgi:hypothetical protein